jgi:hypothetical protein
MSKHYVYIHRNPITNSIFYIGVGYKRRAWSFKWGHSKHYYHYIQKHGLPIVEMYKINLTEDEAYKLEEQLILEYGRVGIDNNGILVNKSSGGKTSAKGNKQYLTDEWKKKIGDANRGKSKHNEQTKKSISTKNSKSIIQQSIEGEIIKEWSSQWDASQKLNINYKSINNCVMGLSKTAGGYIWKLK